MSRARAAGWWLLPVAFLIVFYRDGLSTWFAADDFAWLSLYGIVHRQHDLLHELFAPMAQGTIRPWSERGFFMLLTAIFGPEALPFRIVAFATAAADVVLIASLALRATGSRIAGFTAPLLWIVNAGLVRPMIWASSYNELMCPLFLLGALHLYIRFLDTGQRKYWWWQLVVFSLGFGALEINVVYPALAAAWLLFAQAGTRNASGNWLRSRPRRQFRGSTFCCIESPRQSRLRVLTESSLTVRSSKIWRCTGSGRLSRKGWNASDTAILPACSPSRRARSRSPSI